MLVSLSWIKDFVNLPNLSPKDLAQKFTMGVAEVEEVVSSGEFVDQVQVAQIKKIEPHPEADKLNLVTFDHGGKAEKRVVCGASNVKVGLKVFYAPTGVTLPNGMELTPKKIRGILSEGMLCSAEELCLEDSSDGLLELPDSAEIGLTFAKYFNRQSEIVLNIDNKSLTHRPDLWGHFGMAREFATVFSNSLKNPYDQSWEKNLLGKLTKDANPVTPVLEGASSCLGYYGLTVKGVKVGPSPAWLKSRLESCGLRSINNMVDVSNYVMLELGFPNHIFDRKKIKGDKVIIESLKKNEHFTTLDEVQRELISGDTIIRDQEKILVLGGIMGGENSGVDENTDTVFIEVANWKASMVRKTSVRLGLRTDSSQRYEKSLDSMLMQRTLLRIFELLLELCPNATAVGQIIYSGNDLKNFKPLTIETSVKSIEKQLGHEVGQTRIFEILNSLGFKTENVQNILRVEVPSWRSTKDIECEADIVEEIGRIIGYDNITPRSPHLEVAPVRLSPNQVFHRKIQDFLTSFGRAYEIMTYPLVGLESLKKASWPGSELILINSLSKDHDRMRDSLVPGMLEAIDRNRKHSDTFRLFELGRTYHQEEKEGFASEKYQVCLAFYTKDESDKTFNNLLSSSEAMLNNLGLSADFIERDLKFKNPLVSYDWKGLHPTEFLNIRVMGKIQGALFSVHPWMLRNYKMKGKLALMLLDLTPFVEKEIKSKNKYKPLSKFPGSQFDCTVVAKKSEQVGKILTSLKKIKSSVIEESKIVSIYDLNDQEKAVTIRTYMLDRDATLSAEVIKTTETKIIEELTKAGFPLKQ